MRTIKILLMLLIPVFIYPQNAQDILKGLQNKYKQIKSFTADFEQATNAGIDKKEFKSSGRISFKKENKFRIELKDQTLVTDGKTVWNHNKKMKKVIITNYDSEPTVLSLDKFILEYPGECKVSFAGRGEGKVLFLQPVKNNSPFREIKIYPDESSILSRIEFTDANGNYFSFRFSNVKLDENISDKEFNYLVPKGIRAVDLR